ncbi:probable phosphomannomutase [Ctenocephalides felis]|uniref:probable phosphomannomutase n=1 Tax=Ctenocephalides felis TaxID=7515 RepID=UPI000E6E25B8|nr:probable phosphomannomutase [Ctenocephalides felis]XP_026477834.1 probable phosphomannomutase [Ctenocephalides felis]
MASRDQKIVLFDVDGTLTAPRCVITPEMEKFILEEIKPKATIGLVGGSDLEKMKEQMNGENVLKNFDYVFPENGLIQIKNGVEIGRVSIQKHVGEEKLQEFINYVLKYMSELKLPFKRGTFIEFRAGMFNICPVGRSCSVEERRQFAEYDAKHRVRVKFIEALHKQFPDLGFSFSIGGQISFDAFPRGWDKTYCLQFLTEFPEIHFFGDKTDRGGNDHEIYYHPKTIGHKVTSPEDTMSQLRNLFC